jgi:adenine-specific DNA methylase
VNVIDLFSGSGIVSRYLRTIIDGKSSSLFANDIASYSVALNLATVKKHDKIWWNEYRKNRELMLSFADNTRSTYIPFMSRWWSDGGDGGRKYFTHENGVRLDKMLYWIATHFKNYEYNRDMIMSLIAGIVVEMSIHSNTSGHFASYYREIGGNTTVDLGRIRGQISCTDWYPICSDVANSPSTFIVQSDAIKLLEDFSQKRKFLFDIIYCDSPYNKHPYGTYYFLPELITNIFLNTTSSTTTPLKFMRNYVPPDNFRGQEDTWTRSDFNSLANAKQSMDKILQYSFSILKPKSGTLILSYNNKGIIKTTDMDTMFTHYFGAKNWYKINVD